MATVPRLSIVIPCVGGAAEFDGALVSVLQHRPADSEVLVLHTQPYDDPYDLRGEVQFLHRAECSSIAELINEGIPAASGEIVHILGSGLEATDGWTEPAIGHFKDSQVAAVSPLLMDASGSVLAAGVRYSLGGGRHVVADNRLLSPGTARLRARVLGPILTAGFFRRDVLAALGGFDSLLGDELADLDMALSIRCLERIHICEPASRLIASEQPAAGSASAFARGLRAARLFARHHTGGLDLAIHPFRLAAETLPHGPAGLARLAGHAWGLADQGQRRRQQDRISAARQRLDELAELQAATLRLPDRQRRSAAVRRAA
jgi:hypothetical protein